MFCWSSSHGRRDVRERNILSWSLTQESLRGRSTIVNMINNTSQSHDWSTEDVNQNYSNSYDCALRGKAQFVIFEWRRQYSVCLFFHKCHECRKSCTMNCANRHNHIHAPSPGFVPALPGRVRGRLSPGYIISSSDVTLPTTQVPGNQSELAVQVGLPSTTPQH